MLNVLVACKYPAAPGGLEHIGPHRLMLDTGAPWAAAANALLDRAAAEGGDCLFVDDDVTLLPGCLDGVQQYRAYGDVFGLDLHDLSGARQVGARHILQAGVLTDWVCAGPMYVAHVSTSAVYLSEAVVRAVRFPVWSGIHWEDVAFCMEAWRQGFKVVAVPGRVNHAISGGVGATKRHAPDFWARWQQNQAAFAGWCQGRDLAAVPEGAVDL